MKRLFLQFYISMLVILICTGTIHLVVYNHRYSQKNFQKIEQTLAGGIRIAADQLKAVPDDQWKERLQQIRGRLDFPANIISTTEIPFYAKNRLRVGHDAVLYLDGLDSMICSPLGNEQLLTYGPLPQLTGPSQSEIAIWIFLVLSLIGVAIYLALRPVTRQLRLLEDSIMNFALGNLSTRAIADPSSPILELSQAFNVMASRTENMVRSQRELLQAVSHELRTPLSRIHFGLDLARQATEAQQRREHLDTIENSAEELDDLVGELLLYVRMESAQHQTELSETPVCSTIREAIAGQQALHADKEFSCTIDTEEEILLLADGKDFRRAISNLISNAGKYARSRVRVIVENQSDHVVLRFEDDGPGIPVNEINRIFEPFVRLTEAVKGVGLGLSLVRRILERHQAEISVQRSQIDGAAMIVYWPKDPYQPPCNNRTLNPTTPTGSDES